MTVYELIQKLAELPADMEVVVQRFNSKRRMVPSTVTRLDLSHCERPRNAAVIMCAWEDEEDGIVQGSTKKPFRTYRGVRYYRERIDALDVSQSLPDGSRVIPYERGWAVQYGVSGPYYPELEPET